MMCPVTHEQTAVAMTLEPQVDPMFHPDSYGYRPRKSALDAVEVCKQRCWRRSWVVDLDIQGFFDNVPHAQIVAAVDKHTNLPWVVLYVKRWLGDQCGGGDDHCGVDRQPAVVTRSAAEIREAMCGNLWVPPWVRAPPRPWP
jgi:hypothetical protein